jgi:hypothetical protein
MCVGSCWLSCCGGLVCDWCCVCLRCALYAAPEVISGCLRCVDCTDRVQDRMLHVSASILAHIRHHTRAFCTSASVRRLHATDDVPACLVPNCCAAQKRTDVLPCAAALCLTAVPLSPLRRCLRPTLGSCAACPRASRTLAASTGTSPWRAAPARHRRCTRWGANFYKLMQMQQCLTNACAAF